MRKRVNGRVACVAAWAGSTRRKSDLVNVNAWPKAASLVDARVVHRGDRILRIEALHYRPGMPDFVWTRAVDAAVRAQTRRHNDDRCGQQARTEGMCRGMWQNAVGVTHAHALR